MFQMKFGGSSGSGLDEVSLKSKGRLDLMTSYYTKLNELNVRISKGPCCVIVLVANVS